MDLPLPKTVPPTQPGSVYKSQTRVFDHIPDLRELLPKFRGLPGFDYLQCTSTNLLRAQEEDWTEVDNTVIYVISGPKGDVSMKLMARGQPIPGQPHNSGARLCECEIAVQELTGLWINPHRHKYEDDKDYTSLSELGLAPPEGKPIQDEAPEGEGTTEVTATQKGVVETEVGTPVLPDKDPAVFRSGGGPSAP